MGQILDVVPNHMGVMGSDNAWWLDVLENGEASAYSDFFDIDWEPLKDELQGKVLVPVLSEQYGTVLDRGNLKLTFDMEKGEFSITYFQHRFPVNPREYPRILNGAVEALQRLLAPENEDLLELQSLTSAFSHLPGRTENAPEKRAERIRDKEIHKKRLAALCLRLPDIAAQIENTVAGINGTAGNPSSFDSLHELIKNQAYRLAHWRVAADDINYRRFFDVNDLAALRQENAAVFSQTHELVLELLSKGQLDGLRIDHPDGLYNPQQYFRRLQCGSSADDPEAECSKERYIVVEKILTGDEHLPDQWPIHGTTGYEFSNLLNALFVDTEAEESLTRIYRLFVGERPGFKEQVYQCKKLVIDRLLNSELNVLANHLSRIALADRHTCDFTLKSLRDALTEIVACFPVYRTYVTEQGVSENDQKYIAEAVECAKAKAGFADTSVYDFVGEVLLTRQASGHPQFYERSVLHFAMHFQQYSSAVMAKGFEDTGFYRYHRLISLNDVGGDPMRFGILPQHFHSEIQQRAKLWPHSMVATSTHDSKRSEDVRARIDVLSEMPEEWREQVTRWHELNGGRRIAPAVPTRNDEYLLYQTLVGAWPLHAGQTASPEFAERINNYMLKAVREAKENTSWANPDEKYESALARFVGAVLDNHEFRSEFVSFQAKTSYFGMLNSLSQTVVKLTVPGVPDLYQGNEVWEFNLVDPDNRRPVDYARRRKLLQEVKASTQLSEHCFSEYVRELSRNLQDGRIKMYAVCKTLSLRNSQQHVFMQGGYLPLQVIGKRARHVLAFARTLDSASVVVVIPRLCALLAGGEMKLPVGAKVWQDTKVVLPAPAATSLTNIFTRQSITAVHDREGAILDVSAVLSHFPVAILTS